MLLQQPSGAQGSRAVPPALPDELGKEMQPPRGQPGTCSPGHAQGHGPQPADVPSSSAGRAGTRAGSRTPASFVQPACHPSSRGTGWPQGRTQPPLYGVRPGERSSGHTGTAPCAQHAAVRQETLPAPNLQRKWESGVPVIQIKGFGAGCKSAE